MNNTETILTINEVAAYLRLNPQTVYRLTQKGVLPGFKVGRHWRFHKDIIDSWIKEQIHAGKGVTAANSKAD